jgi:hypothetical protein
MPSARPWLQTPLSSVARVAALVALAAAVVACQRVPDESLSSAGSDETTGGSSSGSSSTGAASNSGNDSSGSVLPEYRCDPADITSCADDEKCTAVFQGPYQNLYQCVPNDTANQLYESCAPSPYDGQDGCPPGTYCGVDSFDNTTGRCVPLCKKDVDCGAGACLTNPFDQVPYCGDACDPLQPSCADGLQCRRGQSSFACSFYAIELDIGEYSAQCYPEYDVGCREGYICLPGALVPACASPTEYCCTDVCDQGADPCDSPASCNEIFTDPLPGFEWVGACYVPA